MSEWTHRLAVTDIPYISRLPGDEREPFICPYYDNEEDGWYTYFHIEGTRYAALYVRDVGGTYVAWHPKDQETDLRLPFSEAIQKHFSFPDVTRYLPELERDVTNSLASIYKYFVLLDHAARTDNVSAKFATSQVAASEIEYAFANHRSAYDLINRVMTALYKRHDKNPATLPDSFRRIAQQTHEELREKYHLPDAMIKFYKRNEEPFMTLRKIRDNILHHGKSVQNVFCSRTGFEISAESDLVKAVDNLQLWEGKGQEAPISLLPLIAFLASDLIKALKAAAETMYLSFEDNLPASIYQSGCKVYLRSKLNQLRLKLDYFMEEQWVLPEEVLAEFQA